MKIGIRVIPRSVREEIVKTGASYVVRVREQPRGGKANEAVIRLVAEHFGVTRSQVRITSGMSGRNKIVEIRT